MNTAGQRVEVRIKGNLDQDWTEWFEGFSISRLEGDETVLVGWVTDQAGLYGMIGKLRDLGIRLVSVNSIEPA